MAKKTYVENTSLWMLSQVTEVFKIAKKACA